MGQRHQKLRPLRQRGHGADAGDRGCSRGRAGCRGTSGCAPGPVHAPPCCGNRRGNSTDRGSTTRTRRTHCRTTGRCAGRARSGSRQVPCLARHWTGAVDRGTLEPVATDLSRYPTRLGSCPGRSCGRGTSRLPQMPRSGSPGPPSTPSAWIMPVSTPFGDQSRPGRHNFPGTPPSISTRSA